MKRATPTVESKLFLRRDPCMFCWRCETVSTIVQFTRSTHVLSLSVILALDRLLHVCMLVSAVVHPRRRASLFVALSFLQYFSASRVHICPTTSHSPHSPRQYLNLPPFTDSDHVGAHFRVKTPHLLRWMVVLATGERASSRRYLLSSFKLTWIFIGSN